jgi:hypothetical protein
VIFAGAVVSVVDKRNAPSDDETTRHLPQSRLPFMKPEAPVNHLARGAKLATAPPSTRARLTGARPVAGAVGACSLMLLACSWFAFGPGRVEAGRELGSPRPVRFDDRTDRTTANRAALRSVVPRQTRHGRTAEKRARARQTAARIKAGADRSSSVSQQAAPAPSVQTAAPSPSPAPVASSTPAPSSTPTLPDGLPAVTPPAVSVPQVPSLPQPQLPDLPVVPTVTPSLGLP